MGWLDELSTVIGLLRSELRSGQTPAADELDAHLRAQQLVLSRIMAEVASGAEPAPAGVRPVTSVDVEHVEELDAELRTITAIGREFPVPGDGSRGSALADLARARCRTAERALVSYMRGEAPGGDAGPADPGAPQPADDHPDSSAAPRLAQAQRYLNRLSDYLFVLARHLE